MGRINPGTRCWGYTLALSSTVRWMSTIWWRCGNTRMRTRINAIDSKTTLTHNHHMNLYSKAIASIALGVFCAASLSSGQTPKPSSESAAFLAQVAGVYRVQFQNGDVNGRKYESEDI